MNDPALTPQPTLKKSRVPRWKRAVRWFAGLRRLNQVALLVVLISVPSGICAVKFGRPLYRDWKQRNALEIARVAMDKGDLQAASLAFRQAVRIDPNRPRVWRALIPFLSSQKSPDVLFAWERLIRLEPESVENRLGAANAALAAGNWERAMSYLNEVPVAHQNEIPFLLASARAYAAAHRLPEANACLEKILQRDPKNADAIFQQDLIRLATPNSPGQSAARVRLRNLASRDEPRSSEALRILIRDQVTSGNYLAAGSDASALIRRKDATVHDRIVALDLDFMTSSLDLPNSIEKLRKWSLEHPDDLGQVAVYLISRGKGAETLEWLQKNASDRLKKPQYRGVMMDLAMSEQKWDLFFSLLGSGDQALPPETVAEIRKIYQEYRDGKPDGMTHWDELLVRFQGNLVILSVLEQLSRAWQWPEARKSALWKIGALVPNNAMVWRQLFAIVVQDRNTPEIASVLSALVAADPSSRQMSNAWLMFQLLLDRGNKSELLALATANLEFAPNDPSFQLTNALALAASDRGAEAVELLDRMSPTARSEKARLPYVAYIYAKGGRSAEAREALAGIGQSSQFLPEEYGLAERARILIDGQGNRLRAPLAIGPEGAEAMLKKLQAEQASENSRSGSASLLDDLRKQRETDSGASEQMKKLREELLPAGQNPR